MNPRERVLTAISHREPDRIPIAIGGSAQKFPEEVIREMIGQYGIPEDSLRPVFAQFRFEYISEPLWEVLGADFRHVYWLPEQGFNLELQQQGAAYIDEWGLDYDFSGHPAGHQGMVRKCRMGQIGGLAEGGGDDFGVSREV